MHGEREEIARLGARLVFIGNGSPAQAIDFRDTHVPGDDVYTDPSLATYTALGAKRGIAATIGPAAAKEGLRALRRGFRQGLVQGNAWVQGAMLVVLPGDRVTWSRLNRHAGDHPPTAEVMDALRAATEAAAR